MLKNQQTVRDIPLSLLIEPPQAREQFDETALESLSATLKDMGQIHPILVRAVGERYEIIEGGRRVYRAAMRAGLPSLKAIVVEQPLDAVQTLQLQVVANGQHEDLNPIEKAKAIRRLMDEGRCPATEVARRLGLSNASVTRLLKVLTLSPELQQRLAEGELSLSAAYELARIEDPEKQSELAQQSADGSLTRDGLTAAGKASGSEAVADAVLRTSRATAPLSEGRTVSVTAQGLTLESFIEAIEELVTKARRARTQGVELPTFVKLLRDQTRAAAAGG